MRKRTEKQRSCSGVTTKLPWRSGNPAIPNFLFPRKVYSLQIYKKSIRKSWHNNNIFSWQAADYLQATDYQHLFQKDKYRRNKNCTKTQRESKRTQENLLPDTEARNRRSWILYSNNFVFSLGLRYFYRVKHVIIQQIPSTRMEIARDRYLEKLIKLRDNGQVKIVTGISHRSLYSQ